MLDLKFIRENPDAIRHAAILKDVHVDLDTLLETDRALRHLQIESEKLRAEKKQIAATTQKILSEAGGAILGFQTLDPRGRQLTERARRINDAIKSNETFQVKLKADLDSLLLQIPNLPYKNAPVGPDESANVVVRTVKEPPKFGFEPLDHVALIEKNDWGDL